MSSAQSKRGTSASSTTPKMHSARRTSSKSPTVIIETELQTDQLFDAVTDSPVTDQHKMRRIIADDPEWTLATVPDLVELTLRHIVDNFASNSMILNKLSLKHRAEVLKRIATDLPLQITACLVDDDDYWRRCCKARWPVCDVSQHGGQWKRMFFERNLQTIIETFVPDTTNSAELEDALSLSSNYIHSLTVRQLLPPVKQRTDTDDNSADDDARFDFNKVLPRLPHLELFDVTYGVRDCGMNFDWSLFRFTTRDCRLLSECIANCTSLRSLTLHRSKVDDDKLRVLIAHLLDHSALRELDLSHNVISDRGARALGKLLNGHSQLTKLSLPNNSIGSSGAHALAHGLTRNTTLRSLDVRLNCLGDDGGQAICRALLRNVTLVDVTLAGNELTDLTATLMAQVVIQNTALLSVDLSCNHLTEEGGRKLVEAMQQNKTLTHMDLRLSECGHEVEYCVNQILIKNRDRRYRTHEINRSSGRTDVTKLG